MKAKIGEKEYTGVVGVLLAIPIIIFTFSVIAAVFGAIALVLLSPLILLVWAIVS